ncbi:MAG TPA: cache domain-containing protein [Magnetospirillum sp.]|jgi:signal transduction histidine kinase|nr:cache domain-containing protein [Magnetospirillum sp.]
MRAFITLFRLVVALVVFAGMSMSAAHAVEYGSRDEAKAMAEKAAQFYTANGKDKAFAAITEGSDGFKDRDLYVFVYDDAGNCVAHGANKALIGKNLIDIRDSDGKALIREIVAVKTAGWVDFKWQNPQTKAIEQKHAYVVRAEGYTFGVGAYDKR